MNPEQAARNIRLVVLDVDGVLTDGGLYYDANGEITKRFYAQDGMGIRLGRQCGLEFAVITGLDSPCVRQRVEALGISYYYPGFTQKTPPLQEIIAHSGISYAETAYVGDDWVDAGPMSRVGFPVAVPHARPEISALALWTTRCPGGSGAVRDVVDFILKAQGQLEPLWRQWKGQ